MPISKAEVDGIINRIEVGEEAPRPKTLFEPGEVVRVCDGPFNDFNGVKHSDGLSLRQGKVSVQILGRSTPVQLDFIQIEKT
jgi:transcriptional antiterminator NusG